MIKKDTDVLVSIIVPTYNHEKYIRKALDSIFMQETSCSYEVLVGDDASTDGTQDILRKYAEQYPDKIKLFLRKQNLGGTRNVYELFRAAKGKYFAICEGDDYWIDDNKLQKQIHFLENNLQFIGVCHKFATVDSDGKPIKKKLGWVRHKKVFRLADFKGIYLPSQPSTFVCWNIFIYKKKDYSFLYKVDRYTSDIVLMLVLLSHNDFCCLDEVMSVYRISTSPTASSVSQIRYKKNAKSIEQDVEMINKFEQLVKEKFKNSVDFTLRRKELYISAIIRIFRTRCFENLAILKKIRGNRNKIEFWAYIPVGFWKRLILKIREVL